MKTLSKAEEQLMEIIWRQEKLFLKDIIEALPVPRPATTTVATLLKRMQEKGYVEYELYGNSRAYFAKVDKDSYFARHLNNLVENYFNNSALEFASFFTTKTKMTGEQLNELKNIINRQLKGKK